MFVLTTLPPNSLDTTMVMSLYRTRWQIELVFKRLKTLLSLSALRTNQHSPLAEVYLYGKLLYAAMLESYLRQYFNVDSYYLNQERRDTPWRLWNLLHQQLMACFSLSTRHSCIPVQSVQKAMRERQRKRKLQTMPNNMIENLLAFKNITLNNSMLA